MLGIASNQPKPRIPYGCDQDGLVAKPKIIIPACDSNGWTPKVDLPKMAETLKQDLFGAGEEQPKKGVSKKAKIIGALAAIAAFVGITTVCKGKGQPKA